MSFKNNPINQSSVLGLQATGLQSGTTALGPNQGGPSDGAGAGRVEALEKHLFQSANQFFSGVLTQSLELVAKAHVLVESFLLTNPFVRWSRHLVLHRLRAEPANPPARITVPDALYVFLRAFLYQGAAVASREHDWVLVSGDDILLHDD